MDAGKFMVDWFIPIWLMITLLEVNILLGEIFLNDFTVSFRKTNMPETNINNNVNFLLQTLFEKNETQNSNKNKKDENENVAMPLSKYYDHVLARVKYFTIKLDILINKWKIYIQFHLIIQKIQF